VTAIALHPNRMWPAGVMILGGVVEIAFGINAEGKSLETVAKPLTSTSDEPAPAPTAA
jgi:hypothetical protein